MNAHLTHEELTDTLMGASSLTVNAHLLECTACAHELERLKSSISSFRDAAHAWSEDNLVATKNDWERALNPTRWQAAKWILVAAALILFVAGSLTYLHEQRIAVLAKSAQVSASAANSALSQSQLSQSQIDQDNQLLSLVSGELAESVPGPMQPLLVSESAASGATNK